MRFTLSAILFILGINNLSDYFRTQPWTMSSVISIGASLLFLAAGMGAVRDLDR